MSLLIFEAVSFLHNYSKNLSSISGNNKKLNTKNYKEKNTIKKVESTDVDKRKTAKKSKTIKALKKNSSKNKEKAPKAKISKKTTEKKKKIKEVKTGWWDQ